MKWLKKRALVHLLIALGFLLVWGLLEYFNFDYLIKGELATVDYRIRYGRTAPVNPDLVFLAIDTASTSVDQIDDKVVAGSKPLSLMRGGYPYNREVYAAICDQLFAAGAKAVAIDIFFQSPKPEDPAWKAAIVRNQDHLVLGMNFSDDQQDGFSTTLTLPASDLLSDNKPTNELLAYLNFWKDNYGTVRDAQYRNNIEHLNHGIPGAENLPKLYSFAARTVLKAGRPDLVPDDLLSRPLRFAGKPETKFPTYSLYKIFEPNSWATNFQKGEFFRDKIVVIGPQGDWTKDELDTPWGRMNGAEIHLNAINDLLQNDFLSPPSTGLTVAIVISASLVALLLGILIVSILWRFVAAVLVLSTYLFILAWTYNGPGWLLPALVPLSLLCATMGVGFIFDFTMTQIEKMRLRATFERYYSTNVARYLMDHTETYKEMLSGERKPVTVLFSDIRSFTTIVETTADSHELVKKLNEYFTEMVDCVFRHDGTLDKFMGDGIMAIWGNTPYNFGPKEDAVRAVRCALDMVVALRKLNARWIIEGKTEWQIGIGLNHGQVIVGDMGSQAHKEFGAVGDAINLGSRLEGLTKEYKQQILIGERVAELVVDNFHLRSVAFAQVKGKTQSVRAFTVLGDKTLELQPEQKKALELYEEGISSFRRREFARAKDLFAQSLQHQPNDYLSSEYLASAAEFLVNPPDNDWTGTRIMTKK